MLIDLHAHSSGISKCCRIPAEQVVRAALEVGLDGIVLTNHYQKNYVTDGDYTAFAKRYVEEFRYAKQCGDALGLKVFFGVEITTEQYPGVHMLLYGIEESLIETHPTLFDLSQEELYRLTKEAGGTVIQAHPYRKGKRLLDTRYMDGVEVNCHPLYGTSDFADMLKIAEGANLILTCGGDYHADTYRPRCGTYLPDTLKDSVELGRLIGTADSLTLCIHEPNTPTPYDFLYVRPSARTPKEGFICD